MTTSKGEGARVFLRPPMGNNAFYSREYLSMARNCIMKAWATPSNSLRREVALTLLADPELRLRICHLEEILRGRQLTGRLQGNGFSSASPLGSGKDLPPVQLQTALADPSFSSFFELDASVNDPDWGMQVLWLNMMQLQKELGLPAAPAPPPALQLQLQTPSAATQPSPKSASSTPTSDAAFPAAFPAAAAIAAVGASQQPLVPEPTLLAAVEAAFPNYASDEDEYLAIAAAYCLSTWRDPKGLLPALSLHLTDLTAHLRACALADQRLESVLRRVAAAAVAAAPALAPAAPTHPLAAKLAELLAAPRTRLVFRQNESLSRRGERVVSLAMEQLMRLAGSGGGGSAGGGVARVSGGCTSSLSPNGPPPYAAWQRAGAAPAAVAAAVASAGASDALPVFLFEYEASGDANGRDDMAAQMAAQRDQYGTSDLRVAATNATDRVAGGINPGGRDSGVAGLLSAASTAASAPTTAAAAGGGGGGASLQTASSAGVLASRAMQPPPPPFQQPPQNQDKQQAQPATCSLQHAWSDGSRGSLTEAAALPPLQQQQQQQQRASLMLQSMASEPLPLLHGGVSGERCSIPGLQPPPVSCSGGGAAAAPATDLYGFRSLGLRLGAEWSPSSKLTMPFEGSPPPTSNDLRNGMRYSLFTGGGGDAQQQQHQHQHQTIASATGTVGSQVVMTAAAPLAASPGGASSEFLVPQEIAEVWSNPAAGGGGGSSGSGLATRRSSVTATVNGVSAAAGGLSALPADGSGGVFAMSPMQESSFWDRLVSPAAPPLKSHATVSRSGTTAAADLGLLGLGGLGLNGYVAAAATGGAAGLGIGGPLIVGSAPTISVPAFASGGAVAAAAAGGGSLVLGTTGLGGGLGGGLSSGGGGGRGVGSGAMLMDYASWHSSPELPSSLGRRSALGADHAAAASALDSSMMLYGTRVNGGGGGGAAAAAAATSGGIGRGAGPNFAESITAAAATAPPIGPDGRAVALRRGTGQTRSVSEESEEAASVVGGLDLDPAVLTLEAIIGFDPSSQLGSLNAMTRRATFSGPTVAAAGAALSPGKGLIAAAAAPRIDAVAVTRPSSGTATPPSSKSFASVSVNSSVRSGGGGAAAAGAAGSSRHSSFDSCEVLNGGGSGGGAATAANTAAVLTSWSAMAARGPPVLSPPAHNHHAAASIHLATAASAASGGRFSAPQLQHGLLSQSGIAAAAEAAQGLAATMAAINAAAGGNGVLTAAAPPRQGSLGHVGDVGGGPAAAAASVVARDVFVGKAMHNRLSLRVKDEICQLIRTVPGLKAEDFDDGVLHQLTLKKSEEEAVGALRMLAGENLSGIQHMAAYINHIIKNYHHLAPGVQLGGAAGAAAASLPSATVRANSTPVSSKAILQKLPLRVYRRLEEVISKCSFIEWKHFDAGVVKVMAQLAEISEEDVYEELEQLQSTDLSNVEYMPAYLNKRLNNRLWSRRKMLSSSAAVGAVGGAAP